MKFSYIQFKKLTPRHIMSLLPYWPPYFGTGIGIDSFNEDYTSITVSLKQRVWNTNYMGSHFGGSLYSMCDPWFMFILIHHLGQDHIVWDKSASIQFLRPGTGKVTAKFEIPMSEIERIRQVAKSEYRQKPKFICEVKDEADKVVAIVEKEIYVRRKDATKEQFNN